jgi:hypothetical protein
VCVATSSRFDRLADGIFSVGAISHSFSAYISKNVAETKSYIIFEMSKEKGISEEGGNSKSQREGNEEAKLKDSPSTTFTGSNIEQR